LCFTGVKHSGTCDLKKKFRSSVANCLKISNLFTEVSLDNAELTSILWRENCTLISAFCSSGARIKADVTKCGHDLESSSYALFYKKFYIN
jgi:hypothetical protein